MRLNKLVTVALALAVIPPTLAQRDTTPPAQGLYFFEGNLPKEITAQGGTVTVSTSRAKDGQSSLLWQFEAGGQLVVDTPITPGADDPVNPRTFWVWVYNPRAIEGDLLFRFGRGLKADRQFRAPLNFTGWRGIAVPFRDMQGEGTADMNRLTITAPAQAGQLYLDQLMVNIPLDNRWAIPDRLMPFVNTGVNTSVNRHWNALLMYDTMLRQRVPNLKFDQNLDDASGDTAGLYQRAEGTLKLDQPVSALEKVLKDFSAYGIQQQPDGRITGPALEFPTHQEHLKVGVYSEDTRKYLTTGTVNLRTLGATLLEMAGLLRNLELTAQQRSDLQSRFVLATRYVLDQGLTAGASYQVIHHLGYQSRELFDAWFVARQLLAQRGLLADTAQAMLWFNGTGRIMTPAQDIVETNVDVLNTQLQWMIKSILMVPDAAQRKELLGALSGWLSQTIVRSDGVAGGFKPDGSIFHHSQQYPAYAIDAFSGLAPAVYILGNSPYALTRPARERLDDSLYKLWLYTRDTRIPLILSGRHPNDRYKISPEPFKWLALSGTADARQKVDPTLAAIYARLTGQEKYLDVVAASEPSGAWAMNYSGMALQKRAAGDGSGKAWTAIARGFSRYLVGNEIYGANNLYGRYMLYGGLEIIPADPAKYPFRPEGWDWNRYPGTTSIVLPWDTLKASLIQLPAAGVEEMLLSTETYLGANALGDNSMFAVKVRGHPKYGQEEFKARKSYFMFDNRIIALGTGITSADSTHDTITTLFQHSVPQNQGVVVNGKTVNQSGMREQLSGAVTLTDPASNTYFIPAGQAVTMTYGQQASVDDMKSTPTQGAFATATLQHGKAPQGATYEYAVLVGQQATTAPQYSVLSRTDQLHAVRDQVTSMTGYAFFDAGETNTDGIVHASDRPNMVMTTPEGSGWKLAVVNPDLGLYSGTEADQVDAQGKQAEVSIYSRNWRASRSTPQTSTVTLKGSWQLAQQSTCAVVQPGDATTNLVVTTVDATPCQVSLQAKPR